MKAIRYYYLTIIVVFITGIAHSASPTVLSQENLLKQINYSTITFFRDLKENDQLPIPLSQLANGSCPNSSETRNNGLARNPPRLYGYVRTFYNTIQILQTDPTHKDLINQMNKAIQIAGDAVISSKIEISDQQWGWNNLSSSWDAWANGTCSNANTPNLYASANALLVLQAAFELTREKKYFDAFVRGSNYWIDFTPSPLLEAGSTYSVLHGTLNVAGIKKFYATKPAVGIFKNIIVGGQQTDFCPGPGCNNNTDTASLSSPSVPGLPRPFRFHYTKDDPGLVANNCSALMGLALLKMGLTLRTINDPQYSMPKYTVPLRSKDGTRTASSEKDLYYIGYWTLYSDYYNLAQSPPNASYYDVDTPLYKDASYESHLATISSPVLAEAGALLKRREYLDAAVKSVDKNQSSIDLKTTDRIYAYCTLQNLNSDFSAYCKSSVLKYSYLNHTYLGVAITQFISNDLTPPTVRLTAPTNNQVVKSPETVSVSAAAADDKGVAEVFFVRNGLTVAIDTAPPFAFDWPVTHDQNGVNEWTAVARDAGGNRQVSSSVRVQVAIEVSPPQIALTSPVAGTISVSGTIPLVAQASDDLGIDKVWLQVDGVTIATGVTYAWPVTHMNNGTHTLTATAFDVSGKQTTSDPVSVRVDIPVPFSDDFEKDLSKWSMTAQQPNTQISLVNAALLGRTGHVALLSDLSTISYCQMQRSGPAMKQVYFKTSVRFQNTFGKHYVFLGTGDKGSLYFLMAKGGRWWMFDGKTELQLMENSADYKSGVWYDVEAAVDFKTRLYDVWVNGSKIGTKIPISGESTTMTGFRFLPAPALMTGAMWVDDTCLATAKPDCAATSALAATRLPSTLDRLESTPKDIGESRAYPIPFRPGRGATGITFDRLPEGAHVSVFTTGGRRVRLLPPTVSGKTIWDLTNDDQAPVASGTYIAEIKDGERRHRMRILVQK